jgi:hypothetical protein
MWEFLLVMLVLFAFPLVTFLLYCLGIYIFCGKAGIDELIESSENSNKMYDKVVSRCCGDMGLVDEVLVAYKVQESIDFELKRDQIVARRVKKRKWLMENLDNDNISAKEYSAMAKEL